MQGTGGHQPSPADAGGVFGSRPLAVGGRLAQSDQHPPEAAGLGQHDVGQVQSHGSRGACGDYANSAEPAVYL